LRQADSACCPQARGSLLLAHLRRSHLRYPHPQRPRPYDGRRAPHPDGL